MFLLLISKEQAKTLLQHYNIIPNKIKALQSAIKHMTDGSDKDLDIESMCLSQNLSGMPFKPAGNTSDKTGVCAQTMDNGTYAAICEHAKAIGVLMYVKEQLDIALETLPATERAIVQLILIDSVPFDRLTEEQRKSIGYYEKTATYKHASASAATIGKIVVFGDFEYNQAAAALNIER